MKTIGQIKSLFDEIMDEAVEDTRGGDLPFFPTLFIFIGKNGYAVPFMVDHRRPPGFDGSPKSQMLLAMMPAYLTGMFCDLDAVIVIATSLLVKKDDYAERIAHVEMVKAGASKEVLEQDGAEPHLMGHYYKIDGSGGGAVSYRFGWKDGKVTLTLRDDDKDLAELWKYEPTRKAILAGQKKTPDTRDFMGFVEMIKKQNELISIIKGGPDGKMPFDFETN